mgnify:CR=1 FL=1
MIFGNIKTNLKSRLQVATLKLSFVKNKVFLETGKHSKTNDTSPDSPNLIEKNTKNKNQVFSFFSIFCKVLRFFQILKLI